VSLADGGQQRLQAERLRSESLGQREARGERDVEVAVAQQSGHVASEHLARPDIETGQRGFEGSFQFGERLIR
jgi:hypothetical protein